MTELWKGGKDNIILPPPLHDKGMKKKTIELVTPDI